MRFTAIHVNPIGEHDEKYGTRYWGQVEDSDMSVSFNLMNPVDIPQGAQLEFEERSIKETGPQSKSPGTEYLFLKKVKVLGGTPTSLPSDKDKTLELILGNTEEILRILNQTVPPQSLKEKWDKTVEKDVVDEDIGDDIANLGQIPF